MNQHPDNHIQAIEWAKEGKLETDATRDGKWGHTLTVSVDVGNVHYRRKPEPELVKPIHCWVIVSENYQDNPLIKHNLSHGFKTKEGCGAITQGERIVEIQEVGPNPKLPINQESTRLAAENGLPHWKCISLKSNEWWIRSDDQELAITNTELLCVYDQLKRFDRLHSMEGQDTKMSNIMKVLISKRFTKKDAEILCTEVMKRATLPES